MKGIELPWRDGVTKAVLVMGDAPPHDPEPVTHYTRKSVAAAAIAVDPAAIYSININGGGSPYFEDLAEDTGGHAYSADDPSTAVDQIIKAITTITSTALVADVGGPYSEAVGEPVTFDASNSGGGTSEIASYEWDFDNDGEYDATTEIPTITHTFVDEYDGKIGLRVTSSAATPETATATANVTILPQSVIRFEGQRAAQIDHEVTLQAAVQDANGRRLKGVPVRFSIGDESCEATSLENGKATCELTLSGPAGKTTVTSEVKPNSQYFVSGDAAEFNIEH
jgi:hypothetical protein